MLPTTRNAQPSKNKLVLGCAESDLQGHDKRVYTASVSTHNNSKLPQPQHLKISVRYSTVHLFSEPTAANLCALLRNEVCL